MSVDTSKRGGKFERVLLVIMPLYLVATFIRLLFPVAEKSSSAVDGLGMIFELAMAVGVIGLGLRVLKSIPPGGPGKAGWVALMVAGTIGALGIFGIRLSGGPRVELPHRPDQLLTEIPSASPELEAFVNRTGEVMTAYDEAESALLQTRWHKAEPKNYRKLPRAALQEHIAREREYVAAIDRIIAVFSEPGFEEKMNRVLASAMAQGKRFDKPDVIVASSKALRRTYTAGYKLQVLIEANWDEWVATPTSSGELVPSRGSSSTVCAQRVSPNLL